MKKTKTETCTHTKKKTESKTLEIVAINNLSTVLKIVTEMVSCTKDKDKDIGSDLVT